nr:hypothetical protein [Trebouxia sp. A1-2]
MVYRYNVDYPIMEKPLNPNFFSGFVQSDGCFHIGLQKDKTAKHKIRIKPTFYVTQLNSKDKKISPLLRMARNLLQVGHYIPDRRNNCSSLRVNTLKDLKYNVLPHFEEYPLLSEKKKDYIVFKEIVEKMNKKVHHSKQGFCDIYNLALSMNKNGGYRKKYKYCAAHNPFFDTLKGCTQRSHRNVRDDKNIKDASLPFQLFESLNDQFVSGLIQGDGSFGFSFRIRTNKNFSNKAKISPFFSLGQESDSIDLLEECQRFFQCGKIYKVSDNYYRWMVSDYCSLNNSILDHLLTFPLLDVKGKQFLVFAECLHILSSKEICEKQKVKNVVECAYNLNMDGKRRRRTKEEYLRAIAS